MDDVEYREDQIVDDEESATRRITSTESGRFPTREFWMVAKDIVSSKLVVPSAVPSAAEDYDPETEEKVKKRLIKGLMQKKRLTGDTLFDAVEDTTLKKRESEARHSATGLSSRWGMTSVTGKNWNRIRVEDFTFSNSMYAETGAYMPFRVKVVALPNDKLADSCESYAEYRMKLDLKGVKGGMSEREFTVYKY